MIAVKFRGIPCLAAAAVLAGCSSSPAPSSSTRSSTTAAAAPGTRAALSITDPYSPKIDPADFSTTIDNPYMPMVPGTRMIYEADTPDGKQRTVTEVTRDTKTVMGVKTVVVHDTVSVAGEQTEDTLDWYAQARDGSVWYFGEQTKEFSDGKVDTTGSFEAGVNGALPGIVMPVSPQVGDKFRQEYAKGVAEDTGEVIDLHGADTTPLTGSVRDLVVTKDADMLEPHAPAEHKFFAKGIGLILTVTDGQPPQRDQAIKAEKF